MSDEELMLVSAVRYALGRMTYMVGITCRYVTSKLPELSEHCIHIIIRDIEEEMERYHRCGQMRGMECDEKEWMRLLERLKGGVK